MTSLQWGSRGPLRKRMTKEHTHTHTHTTVLRPFIRDHPGEPVPEENFWTLWCKGRLAEVDTDQRTPEKESRVQVLLAGGRVRWQYKM